jgi:hypothetical protein
LAEVRIGIEEDLCWREELVFAVAETVSEHSEIVVGRANGAIDYALVTGYVLIFAICILVVGESVVVG